MLTIYGRSTPYCPKCEQAKTMLGAKDVEYEYIDLSETPEAMSKLVGREIPQIFSGDEHIGDLRAALRFIQNA